MLGIMVADGGLRIGVEERLCQGIEAHSPVLSYGEQR